MSATSFRGIELLPTPLVHALRVIAQTPKLLVACDYDGTLAELTSDPAKAIPDPDALRAFRALGAFAGTTTAIVSGRSLSDLIIFLGADGPDIWVGSHGAEWATPGVALKAEQRQLLAQVAGEAELIAKRLVGVQRELKPAGVALHFRDAEPSMARVAVDLAIGRCAVPGVHVRQGNKVVEFMVVPGDKGEAVGRCKRAMESTGAVFIGDDLTDEDVFRTLSLDDIGVRVGPGESSARHRVEGVEDVAAILEELVWWRRHWADRQGAVVADMEADSLGRS